MSPSSRFRTTFSTVAIAHGVVLGLLLLAGTHSFFKDKTESDVMPADFTVAVDNGPLNLDYKPAVAPPAPPKPTPPAPPAPPPPPPKAPDPEPERAEIVPDKPADIVKKPDPPKKTPSKPVEVVKKPVEPVKKPGTDTSGKKTTSTAKSTAKSTSNDPNAIPGKKVELGRRVTAPNPNPPPPGRRLSQEEIARRLAMGATPASRDLMPEGDTLYFEIIRRKLYKAWTQPGAVPRQLSAEVELKLNASGMILSRRLIRPSGNTIMDNSVLDAVQSVQKIDGLTPTFIDRKAGRVTITFELNVGAT